MRVYSTPAYWYLQVSHPVRTREETFWETQIQKQVTRPPYPHPLQLLLNVAAILPPAPLLLGSKQVNFSHSSPGAAPPIFISSGRQIYLKARSSLSHSSLGTGGP